MKKRRLEKTLGPRCEPQLGRFKFPLTGLNVRFAHKKKKKKKVKEEVRNGLTRARGDLHAQVRRAA